MVCLPFPVMGGKHGIVSPTGKLSEALRSKTEEFLLCLPYVLLWVESTLRVHLPTGGQMMVIVISSFGIKHININEPFCFTVPKWISGHSYHSHFKPPKPRFFWDMAASIWRSSQAIASQVGLVKGLTLWGKILGNPGILQRENLQSDYLQCTPSGKHTKNDGESQLLGKSTNFRTGHVQ